MSIRPSNLRNSKSCKLYAGILKTAIFLGNSREIRTKVIAWKPLFLHIYIYIYKDCTRIMCFSTCHEFYVHMNNIAFICLFQNQNQYSRDCVWHFHLCRCILNLNLSHSIFFLIWYYINLKVLMITCFNLCFISC